MATEDMDIVSKYHIKIESDSDGDDDAVNRELEKNLVQEEDPRLLSKPIVYTTKLDDMDTVKNNLEELNAKEITEKLLSESKPKLTLLSSRNLSKVENIESYVNLASFVQHVNYKARFKKRNIITKHSNLINQCKPFGVVLKDGKKFSRPNNKTQALKDVSNGSKNELVLIDCSTRISDVEVKIEPIDVPEGETSNSKIQNQVIDTSINKNSREAVIIEISDSEINKTVKENYENKLLQNRALSAAIKKTNQHTDIITVNAAKRAKIAESPRPSTETGPSSKKSKAVESLHPSTEAGSSSKNAKIVETPRPCSETVSDHPVPNKKCKTSAIPRCADPESSDEDDKALVHFRRKPVTQPVNNEKFVLIVLLHTTEEAHVYRVNSIKLVTDYYITRKFDEYKIAAMYPKEEKIIEHYCCWVKREEVTTKICTRKNYSFTIQKFLRQPHLCHAGACKCCCRIKKASNTKGEPQTQNSNVVNKSLATADEWIRSLLNRKKSPNIGLIAKAMSYIPKPQVKEKEIAKEPVEYLEFILQIKYTDLQNSSINIFELYEIGRNGNVVRSYILDDPKKEDIIRKTYMSMKLQTMEATYCCWYKREELMLELRKAYVSATARKLIQIPHYCEGKNCNCCCKPQNIPLKGVEVLPPTFKHTTSYERNAQLLSIRFNVKSKNPQIKISNTHCNLKSTIIKNSTCALTENEHTAVLTKSIPTETEIARKPDTLDICSNILNKFKNLKLGVTSGKLEAILPGPARNLSIAELKVLAEILSLSTKQIAELKLPPEEFCERINTNTGQSKDVSAPDIPVMETRSPPSPPKENIQATRIKKPLKPILMTIEKPTSPKMAPSSVSLKISKPNLTNMYSSISNLMETKNKNFVDSFKSFFSSDHSGVTGSKPASDIQSVKKVVLPNIADTYTLAKPSKKAKYSDQFGRSKKENTSSIEKAGPSGQSRYNTRRRGLPLTGELSRSKSATSSNMESSECDLNVNAVLSRAAKDYSSTQPAKRIESYDYSQIDSKVHVKASSGLKATDSTQATLDTVADNTESNQLQEWPSPIVIKREPQTNIQTIVRPTQPISININPNLQTQAYVIENSAMNAPNIQLVQTSKPNVYVSNGNATVTNGNLNKCYMTLTPVTVTGGNDNNADNSILTQILKTPQVPPTVTALGNLLPPLVPIRSVAITRKPGPKSVVQSRTNVPPVAKKN